MEKKIYKTPQMESVCLTTSYGIMQIQAISPGPGSGSASDPSAPEQAPRRRVF